MTAPLLLPSGHGGQGTGRPNLFSRIGSRLFGADPSVEMLPDERNLALRNALMSAGTGMAMAAGGPRRWGEFAPSPIASVMAGLAAGREGYQNVQNESVQRGLLAAYSDPNATPQGRRNALLGLLQRTNATGEAAGMLRQLATQTEEKQTAYRPGYGYGDSPETARVVVPITPKAPGTRLIATASGQEIVPDVPGTVRGPRPRGVGGGGPTDIRIAQLDREIDDARGAIATARGGFSAQAQRQGIPRTPADTAATVEIVGQTARLRRLTAEREALRAGTTPAVAPPVTPVLTPAERVRRRAALGL
jgi:hypothetical protein